MRLSGGGTQVSRFGVQAKGLTLDGGGYLCSGYGVQCDPTEVLGRYLALL